MRTIAVAMCATFVVSGCATPTGIKDVMLPLAVVRKVVMENVPGGLSKQSMNGREILGQYFNAKNLDEPSDTALDRARAKISILGSRRPYLITATVYRERRSKDSKRYRKLGEDPRLAQQVLKRVKEALANRPADINVIDDFRAF